MNHMSSLLLGRGIQQGGVFLVKERLLQSNFFSFFDFFLFCFVFFC